MNRPASPPTPPRAARAPLRPEQAWLLVWALALALALAAGAAYLVRKHQWAQQTLDAANPRIARLLGLRDGAQALAQAQAAVQDNLSQWVWPAEGGDIGTEALQQVRQAAARHGLRVTSSQTAAAAQSPEGFERIDLDVRAEGEWAAFQPWLRDLAQLRPAVFMASANLGADGPFPHRPQQTAHMQLAFFVLRPTP